MIRERITRMNGMKLKNENIGHYENLPESKMIRLYKSLPKGNGGSPTA